MWRPCTIEWGVAPRIVGGNVDRLLATDEGRIYRWFASGLIVPDVTPDGAQQVVRLVDLRYGYVNDPLQSMWGVQALFDPEGRLVGRPERFDNRPDVNGDNVRGLFADAFPQTCPDPAG